MRSTLSEQVNQEMDHMDMLESQSIYILREAYRKFKKLAMLWSVGKDSTVLLWLARKAFFGHCPMPLGHIDTTLKIPEMIELRDKIAGGEISAEEATSAYLQAIEKTEGQLAAFNAVLAERAIDQAKAIDAKRAAGEPLGALGGVPVAIKDNLCTPWCKTTCSSKILADFCPPYTATAVEKLEAAGAVAFRPGECATAMSEQFAFHQLG